jgi:hypothetical protein
MSTSIAILEQQLAELQRVPINVTPITPLAQFVPTVVSEPTVTVSLSDLRSMVKEMVGDGIAEVDVKPNVKEYTLLEALNSALTSDEQSWLVKEDVLRNVANFMATDDGKEITKLFITDYRKYYESKT